jgi:integrase
MLAPYGFRMAWIYEHPRSKNWFIGWRVNGKLMARSTGTASKTEAQKKLATLALMEQAKSAGRLTEDFYRSLTAQEIVKVPFQKAVAAFLGQAPSGGTRGAYASILRIVGRYLNANEQKPDVADVSRAAIRAFLDEHAAKTSAGTGNYYRRVLTTFFNFCAGEYRITSPMEGVKKIEASTTAMRNAIGTGRRPFTEDELRRAYAVANPFWRFAMATAFYTGFRLGMIVTLRWRNLDLRKWTITVIDNKHRREGQRTVPIVSPALRAMLRAMRDANPKAADGDYLFPTYARRYLSTPSKPDGSASELSKEFRASVLVPAGLAKAYNPPKHGTGRVCRRPASALTFHSIKHNTVTGLKASGASEMAAREVVGHDSKAVSQLYTHTTQEHMADALRLLPEVFTTPAK